MQHSLNVLDERSLHDTPFAMPLLPPGVGEVDVYGVHRIGRQDIAKKPQGVALQDLAIGAVAGDQLRGG